MINIVSIPIPKKYRHWYGGISVAEIEFNANMISVNNVSQYQLKLIRDSHHAVIKPNNPADFLVVGEFTKYFVFHTLNNRFLHEINLIRSAVYSLVFPSPIAYVLRNHTLIHPGPCYEQSPEIITLKTLYSVKNGDERCVICERAFL